MFVNNVYVPDSALLWNAFGYAAIPQDQVQVNLNNPNAGFMRGIEIDWQTSFWYLPFPLNLFVLDINYTKSGSNMAYREITNSVVPVLQANGRYKNTYITTDTVYVGRLIQQANDVVNAALGVDYKGLSARLSFNMQGNVLNNVGNRPEASGFTGNVYRWDFTIKQNLPLEGLSIALNGTNIFHNGISTYRYYRMGPDLPVTKNLQSVLYPISTFQANLRYSF
jgi:hypothetical protein